MLALGEPISLPALARFLLALLFDVTLKGTLLLALAGVVTVLFKNASAAARHLIWSLAICALLLLPALTLTLPAWRVAALTDIPYLEQAAAPLLGAPGLPAGLFAGQDPDASAAGSTSAAAPASEAVAPPPGDAVPVAFHQAVVTTVAGWFEVARETPWEVWGLAAWLAGVLTMTLRLLLGAAGVFWLAIRARRFEEPEWEALVAALRTRISLRRRVRLLRSTRTAMPMTWGLLRPVILLPVSARDWSEARRRCVLTHELAHVKRRDCLTQSIVQLANALYWFNPLVWVAARAMRETRERACDDVVLAEGIKPSNYARHLLEIARSTRSTFVVPPGVAAMARPSQLEGRVVAILDAAQRRGQVETSFKTFGVVVTALLAVPLAALRPGAPNVEAISSTIPVFNTVRTTHGAALHWSGPVGRGEVVEAIAYAGGIQATPASGKAVDVFVLGAETRADAPEISLHEGVLSIRDRPPVEDCGCMDEAGAIRLLVRVPEGVHFSGTTRDGDLTVVGLRGNVIAVSEGGDIFASATGFIQAETVDGDIDLRSAAFGEARTVGGDIHARFGETSWRGVLPLRTQTGDIALDLPADAHAEIDLYVEANGLLRAALPLQRSAQRVGERYHGILGRGGRLLRISTAGGDVAITYAGEGPLRPLGEVEVGSRSRADELFRAEAGAEPSWQAAFGKRSVEARIQMTGSAATR